LRGASLRTRHEAVAVTATPAAIAGGSSGILFAEIAIGVDEISEFATTPFPSAGLHMGPIGRTRLSTSDVGGKAVIDAQQLKMCAEWIFATGLIGCDELEKTWSAYERPTPMAV
jgi:hypothetical protein